MPNNLRSRMIRAAFMDPALRPRLLPLITKAAARSDLSWAVDEIETALDNLGDVVKVLEARGSASGDPSSLADDFSDVASAVQDIQKFSQGMVTHLTKMKRLGR